jgi:hypothetical protein
VVSHGLRGAGGGERQQEAEEEAVNDKVVGLLGPQEQPLQHSPRHRCSYGVYMVFICRTPRSKEQLLQHGPRHRGSYGVYMVYIWFPTRTTLQLRPRHRHVLLMCFYCVANVLPNVLTTTDAHRLATNTHTHRQTQTHTHTHTHKHTHITTTTSAA